MFLFHLTYVKPLEEIERLLPAHIQFLDEFYAKGKFLCSGRKEPRTGGVILCRCGSLAEAEAIRDALKAHMGDSEELRAGEYRVTWKNVTASRLDTTALKKALPEVAEHFTKTTTTRRFCVA